MQLEHHRIAMQMADNKGSSTVPFNNALIYFRKARSVVTQRVLIQSNM